MNLAGKLKRLILICFRILFVATPLLWTPLNYELFEFNKMVFVYLMTVIILGLWIGRMLLEKRIIFHKTVLFWPLLAFLISQILATIFSIDPHMSIFGYYSRFHGGLLSTVCWVILFFALVSNGSETWARKIIFSAFVSGLLVAVYGIAQHFGIDKSLWVQDVQNRVFSTLGQPNWLATFLLVFLFLCLGRIIFSAEKRIGWHIVFLVIFFLCFLYTKSRSGFLGFGAGFAFLWLVAPWLKFVKTGGKLQIKSLEWTSVVLILLCLQIGTPFTPTISQIVKNREIRTEQERGLASATDTVRQDGEAAPLITPSSEIRKIVWKGAIELWRRFPVFGTGVETFAHSYYWVRPQEHNLTSEWDYLYNKAHNEYLNLLATSGTVGFIAYAAIFIILSIWLFRQGCQIKFPLRLNRDERRQRLEKSVFRFSFFAIVLSILVANFFGFSVVTTNLWLLPGLGMLFLAKENEGGSKSKSGPMGWQNKVALTTLFFLSGYAILQIANYWFGDYYFQAGLKNEQQGKFQESLTNLQRSVSLNSKEPLYYSKMALTLADLAWAAEKEGRGSESAQLQKMAREVSLHARESSPFQINFYRDEAKMYYILSQIDPEQLRYALEAILLAEKLAPTDAKLFYNAGLMYFSLGDKKRGEDSMRAALQLKPDYERARQFLP